MQSHIAQDLGNKVAENFASQMRRFFSRAELDDVSDANTAETDANVCHSHDLCDANELMAVAFRSVTGRDMDVQSEDDRLIWSEAFEAFRYHGSRIGRALTACGFVFAHRGGGMFNWSKKLADGLEAYCCAEDGCEPDDTHSVRFGIHTDGDNSLCEREYETGRKLADVLNARA